MNARPGRLNLLGWPGSGSWLTTKGTAWNFAIIRLAACHASLATPPRGIDERAMTTTLALIASGILIGAGITLICRDVLRNRRKAPTFVLKRDQPAADGAGED